MRLRSVSRGSSAAARARGKQAQARVRHTATRMRNRNEARYGGKRWVTNDNQTVVPRRREGDENPILRLLRHFAGPFWFPWSEGCEGGAGSPSRPEFRRAPRLNPGRLGEPAPPFSPPSW